MANDVTPKFDVKIGVWSLLITLAVAATAWGKLSTDVTNAYSNSVINSQKIQVLVDAVNDQKVNTARVEEGIKRQSDKIDYVIKLIEQKDKSSK